MIETYYAQALISTVDRGMSEEEAVEKIIALLRQKGHLKLLPRIKRRVDRIIAKRERFETPKIRVATRQDHTKLKATIEAHIQALTDKEPRVLEDDTVIGGYVIETHNTMIDASYRSALMKLYRNIVS